MAYYLILKVVESERVCESKLGFCFVGPLGFEGDGEIANAVSFNREGTGVLSRDNEVTSIFRTVGLPLNFDTPIPLGVVNDGQILSHLPSGWHAHLQNSFEGFGLDSKDYFVSSDIGFRFIAEKNVGGEFIDRVFTDDSKWDFVV